jgi:hypothetical protein
MHFDAVDRQDTQMRILEQVGQLQAPVGGPPRW